MNLKNIEDLIKNQKIKKAIMKIIEYEQSQLHLNTPRYKQQYQEIIQEAINENNQD